jgi:U3 small nucleolar RNA-associated protein 18
MAKAKGSKATKPKELPVVLQNLDDESQDESDVEIKVDGEIEKDETEEELERLVFGDSAGFKAGLRDFDNEDDVEEEDDTGLEGLDDAAVG